MSPPNNSDVSLILERIGDGDYAAVERLLPLVYEDLRRLAAARLNRERSGQTLQATALVHEAYLRLVDVSESQTWESRGHFFGAAAEAMRRILVDNARRRKRVKHGGEFQRISIELTDIPQEQLDEQLVLLDEALTRFAEVDELACELVKLRYFAGIPLTDVAHMLDLPPRTAYRLWDYSKAWLLRELRK